MTTFTVGQRVRTLVRSQARWPGAFQAPVGTLGTITGLPNRLFIDYAVLLDGHPDQPPASYLPHEIAPAWPEPR